jgi:hypothetical protein
MTDEKKPLTVKFAPGVLEQMENEFEPEELQEFLNHLAELAASGEILEKSEAIDMDVLKKEDPEMHKILSQQLDGVYEEEDPTLH